MFAVALFYVCVIGGSGCINITDDRGPYEDLIKCETRLGEIIGSVAAQLQWPFTYQAACAEVDEAGEQIGPIVQYVYPGDEQK